VENVIASHESNGLDIIIALLVSDINPLRKQRIDLVLQLKVRNDCTSSVHLIYAIVCTSCEWGMDWKNKPSRLVIFFQSGRYVLQMYTLYALILLLDISSVILPVKMHFSNNQSLVKIEKED